MSKEMEIIQSEFVSLISHELRTPLTSIMEGTSLLLEGLVGELNEKQRRCLEIIRDDVQRLNRVLMDILQLSRIESGNVVLEESEVSLPELLHSVRSLVEAQIRQKNLRFSEQIDPETSVIVTDLEKLQSILFNLMTNAVKFTPEGGNVEVSARSPQNRLASGEAGVEICFKDSGVGISPKNLEQIFKPFSQLQRGGDRPTGSVGLGLAITKAFVEMLGGKIDVDSEVGKGSSFTVTLPLRLKKEEKLEKPWAEKKAPRRKIKVMVVDDEIHIREMVAMRLELSGYEVIQAGSGEEALERLQQNRPDLILLDLIMPGLGGKGTLQRLKESPDLRSIPVIVVSAKTDEIGHDREAEPHADGYLAKPFVSDDLLRAIRQVVPS